MSRISNKKIIIALSMLIAITLSVVGATVVNAVTTYTINYTLDGNGKIMNVEGTEEKNEDVGTEEKITGALVVVPTTSPHWFIAWTENGKIVSLNEKFIPTGEQIKDTTYTAFVSNSSRRRLAVVVNNTEWGKVGRVSGGTISGTNDYTNTIIGNTLGSTISYQANSGYSFDRFELNGEKLSVTSFKPSDYSLNEDKQYVLKAYFKPTNSTGEVTYTTDGRGSVTNNQDYISSTNTPAGSTAIPNDEEMYFLHWKNKAGEVVSTNQTFVPTSEQMKNGEVFTAVFAGYVINYNTDNSAGGAGTVSVSQEDGAASSIQGSTVTVTSGWFLAWIDENKKIVSTEKTFVPSGDKLVDGATYYAATANRGRVLYIVNDINAGKIGRKSGGIISGTNDISNTIQAANLGMTISTQANTGYVFDHFELDGEKLVDENGNAVNSYSGSNVPDNNKPSIFKAFFRPENSTGMITYKTDKTGEFEGTVTNDSEFVVPGQPITGATAVETDDCEFVYWTANGEYYSDDKILNPTEADAGKEFVAVFKDLTAGRIKYNINIANLSENQVTWANGTNEFEENITKTQVTKCLMYALKGVYPAAPDGSNFDTFIVTDNKPEVEGYTFVGWFDKDRTGSEGGEAPSIRYAGDEVKYVYSGNDYTLDALWALISVDDVEVPYDGQTHTIDEVNVRIDMSAFEESAGVEEGKDYVEEINSLGKFTHEIKYYDDTFTNEIEKPLYTNVGTNNVNYKAYIYFNNILMKEIEGTAKVKINPLPITLTPEDVEVTYGDDINLDDAIAIPSITTPNNEVLEYTIATDAQKGDSIGENYKTQIKLTPGSSINSNYAITLEDGKLKILPRPVILKVNPEYTSREYGQDNPEVSVDMTGVIAGEENLINYTLDELPTKYANIGEYDTTITAEETQGNYIVTKIPGILEITRKTRDITVTGIEKTYDKNSYSVTVDGIIEGEDTVKYSLDGANWTDEKPTFTNVTDEPIRVYVKVINSNTNPDEIVKNATVTINPKTVTVVAKDKSINYNEEIPQLEADVTGLLEGDNIEYTLSTDAIKGSAAGDYDIVVSTPNATTTRQGNYEVEIINGKLTILPIDREDITVENYEGFYDKDSHTITVSGTIEEDKVEYSLDNSTWSQVAPTKTDITEAVTVYVKVTNNNYTQATITKTATITINPVEVTLTVTPQEAHRAYKAENPEFTVQKEGVLDGEEDKIVFTLKDNLPSTNADAGEYPVEIEAERIQGNYIVTVVNGKLIVDKVEHPTISATGYEDIYDAQAHTITVSGIIEGEDDVKYSTDGTNWSETLPQITNVSESTTVYVKVTNPNSTQGVLTTQADVTILKRPVTITAQDKVVKYNAEIPELDAEVVGTINNETVEYTLSTEATKGSPSGEYDIVVNTTKDQGNYDVSFVNAKLTIDPNAREDITIVNYEGTYDKAPHTIQVNGTIEGDKVEYSLDGNVWSTTIPTFTNVTEGSLVYVKVTNPNTTPSELRKTGKVIINPIEITITADRKNAVYGQDIPELTAAVGATIDGYNIEYTLATSAQKGSDVGEYDITVTASPIQGNYKVIVINNILEITPIAHESINAISYYGEYDGKEHSITIEGLIDGDEVEYSVDKVEWVKELPTFVDVIDGQVVYVRVTNRNTIEPIEAQATVTIIDVINTDSDHKGDKEKNYNSQTNTEDTTPNTGDNILVYVLILSLSIVGIKIVKLIKE